MGKRKQQEKNRDVIPPRSVVELIKADRKTPEWKGMVGNQFRIGYYNPNHGLEDIWIVNSQGEYWDVIDNDLLEKYFKIIKYSNETDLFGTNRPKLGKLKKPMKETNS